jgi:hypothetical protein
VARSKQQVCHAHTIKITASTAANLRFIKWEDNAKGPAIQKKIEQLTLAGRPTIVPVTYARFRASRQEAAERTNHEEAPGPENDGLHAH